MKLKHFFIVLAAMLIPVTGFSPNVNPQANPFTLADLMHKQEILQDLIQYHTHYQDFKKALALMESTNDWRKYNPYGYIGKYQFGQDALNATGFGSINFYDFIDDPAIFDENQQEKAMDRLLKLNEQVLTPYIEEYVGHKLLDSITITRMGLLAAAHLGGPGNVKRFLQSEGLFNPKDRMGTRLSDYLSQFSSL